MPTLVVVVVLGLFGLVFGSFANVVIWRLPRGESVVSPGSRCPRCDADIRWYDNIPVLSWLALGGRCRDCGVGISVRYPVVELLSGAVWALAGALWGFAAYGTTALFGAFFFYVLLLLGFIDAETMRLPNPIVAALALIGTGAVLIAQFTRVPVLPLTPVASGWLAQPVIAALVGSIAGAGLTLVTSLAYAAVRGRRGFGVGDLKLLAAMGPFLGSYVLLALVAGSILGAVWGIGTSVAGHGDLARKIPFGPFLAAGAVLTAAVGPAAWAWYLALVRAPWASV